MKLAIALVTRGTVAPGDAAAAANAVRVHERVAKALTSPRSQSFQLGDCELPPVAACVSAFPDAYAATGNLEREAVFLFW